MTLICGINPVLEALNAATRHFERLLIVKGLRNQRLAEIVTRASQMGIPLRFEARETLDRLADGLRHQGIIAMVSVKQLTTPESLLQEARHPGLILLLDGVEDPRNLGAILRTAEAAGVDGVLLPDRHAAGLSDTVSRASAGALEHVKIARVGNVAQTLESLKSRGFWTVGFDALGPDRWDAVDYRRPLVLVLGGEGRGIRRLVRERCDQVVSIPLFGHVGSLNVSVAAGIALYEVVRQRGLVPSHLRPISNRPAVASVSASPAGGSVAAEASPLEVVRAEVHVEEIEEWPPRPLILLEDDVAWAPPQVLSRGRGSERVDKRRRRGRSRRVSGATPAVPSASPAPSRPERSPTSPAGRGKRRRQRGRRRGGAPEATPSGAPAELQPLASAEPQPGGAASKAPRRRRRRRRR